MGLVSKPESLPVLMTACTVKLPREISPQRQLLNESGFGPLLLNSKSSSRYSVLTAMDLIQASNTKMPPGPEDGQIRPTPGGGLCSAGTHHCCVESRAPCQQTFLFPCFYLFIFFPRSLKSRFFFFLVLAPNILKFHAKQNMYAEHIRPLGCHVATPDPVQWFSHFFFFSRRRFSPNKLFCGTATD